MADGPSPDLGKALEGLGHVQTAAVEMIKAARAFLDVAEDLVTDPGTAQAVMTAFATVARAAAQATAAPAEHGEPRDGGVERIVVE